eukprot:bmy_16716T0
MELAMWQLVEADTSSLPRVLDELTLCKADLETQVESLKEELMCLKGVRVEPKGPRDAAEWLQSSQGPSKAEIFSILCSIFSHLLGEEVDALRCQLGDRLNVEVDAATPVDLNRVPEETWCQYGAPVENNHRDMEELNQQVATSSEQLQSYQSDISDLRRTVNTLEIELQAQHSLLWISGSTEYRCRHPGRRRGKRKRGEEGDGEGEEDAAGGGGPDLATTIACPADQLRDKRAMFQI